MSHIPHPSMSPPAPTPLCHPAPTPLCHPAPTPHAPRRQCPQCRQTRRSALTRHSTPLPARLRLRTSSPRLPVPATPPPTPPYAAGHAHHACARHSHDYPSRQRLPPRPPMLPAMPTLRMRLSFPRLPAPSTPLLSILTITRPANALACHFCYYPPSQCIPPRPPYAADCACLCLCLCLSFPLPPVPSTLSSFISMTACPAAAFTTDPFAGQCCLWLLLFRC